MEQNLREIEGIILAYHRLQSDFADIDRLITARRKLACSLYLLATHVGMLKKEANRLEFSRRAKYARTRLDEVSKGTNASQSDIIASGAVVDELNEEQRSDADYNAARLILDAGKDVLETMNQHIANLRSEKNAGHVQV